MVPPWFTCTNKTTLIGAVVRRFFGDMHVVHMAFAHTRRSDFYKLGLIMHFGNGGATAVTHAGTQAAAIW